MQKKSFEIDFRFKTVVVIWGQSKINVGDIFISPFFRNCAISQKTILVLLNKQKSDKKVQRAKARSKIIDGGVNKCHAFAIGKMILGI